MLPRTKNHARVFKDLRTTRRQGASCTIATDPALPQKPREVFAFPQFGTAKPAELPFAHEKFRVMHDAPPGGIELVFDDSVTHLMIDHVL
jgi:hypothetical protein